MREIVGIGGEAGVAGRAWPRADMILGVRLAGISGCTRPGGAQGLNMAFETDARMQVRKSGRAAAGMVLMVAAAVAGISGCVGYNVYPPQPGVTAGFTNPNSDPFPPIMTEALRWAITRYPAVTPAEWSPPLGVPPEGSRFAVNLPVGVNRLVYQRVAERVGFGAVPMEPGNEHLPTYHISRVWVSGDEAKVDIVRPVPGMPPTADGRPVTQGITVRLRGGLQPWRVTSHRPWEINALPTPPLNYMPEPGVEPPNPRDAAVTKDGEG
jgi:hypothetical protein